MSNLFILSVTSLICSRPEDYKELYNLRHASARNVVERIFGVVKRRFRLMIAAPEYSVTTQAKIVHALCVLHNFIRVHDPDDFEPTDLDACEHLSAQDTAATFGGHVSQAEREEAGLRRDRIAKEMWDSYVAHHTD